MHSHLLGLFRFCEKPSQPKRHLDLPKAPPLFPIGNGLLCHPDVPREVPLAEP